MTYQIKQSTTAYPLVFFMVDSTDHVTGKTGLTPTVTLSKSGAAFASPSGAVTEIANGWYKVAGNATDSNTLGPLLLHATATGADATDMMYEVVAYDPQDATALGLSRIDAAVTSRMATFTLPTNFSSLAITAGGAVTAGTVSDKTGYSLTQTFPTNFASLAITVGGAVTAGTVSDKTGYSLSQSFPTNFSSLAITVGGSVTAGTVSDKTGYSLTQAFPTNFSSISIDASGNVSTKANVKTNTALSNFEFLMTDSTNHLPKTGLTVSCTRSIDGAAFAAGTLANIAEVANGMYRVDFGAGDLNGKVVVLRATATGADDTLITLVTTP